ncbi:MAG: hotdog domain-containing protein [Actinomycetes bacterium]
MSNVYFPQPGASAALEFVVAIDDTAIALGSGDLPVLATPRVIAWLEAACVSALDIPDGKTSVGTRVEIEHFAASAVGSRVTVNATISYLDGRLIRFDVAAEQVGDRQVHDGEPVSTVTRLAHGSMTRVVVDRERFMARL